MDPTERLAQDSRSTVIFCVHAQKKERTWLCCVKLLYRVESVRRGVVEQDASLPDQPVLVVRVGFVVSPDLQSEVAGRSRRTNLLDEHVEVAQNAGGQRVPGVDPDPVAVATDRLRLAASDRRTVQVAAAAAVRDHRQRPVCITNTRLLASDVIYTSRAVAI